MKWCSDAFDSFGCGFNRRSILSRLHNLHMIHEDLRSATGLQRGPGPCLTPEPWGSLASLTFLSHTRHECGGVKDEPGASGAMEIEPGPSGMVPDASVIAPAPAASSTDATLAHLSEEEDAALKKAIALSLQEPEVPGVGWDLKQAIAASLQEPEDPGLVPRPKPFLQHLSSHKKLYL